MRNLGLDTVPMASANLLALEFPIEKTDACTGIRRVLPVCTWKGTELECFPTAGECMLSVGETIRGMKAQDAESIQHARGCETHRGWGNQGDSTKRHRSDFCLHMVNINLVRS